jgi:hypothetical protein
VVFHTSQRWLTNHFSSCGRGERFRTANSAKNILTYAASPATKKKIEEIVLAIRQTLKPPVVSQRARQIAEWNKNGYPIKSQTKHYRTIAAQLAKKHLLPFDLKLARKKVTITERVVQTPVHGTS